MSSGVSVDISELVRGLEEARRRVMEVAAGALVVFATMVIGNSQQLTPVDTGFLAASGTWSDARIEGGGNAIVVDVGHNAVYAAAVHERLGAAHKVGQAKFLSTALAGMAGKFEAFVGGRVGGALGS